MGFYALSGESDSEFVYTDNGGIVIFGEVDGIAEVVAVGVCEDDEVRFNIGCLDGGEGITCDKRVNSDSVFAIG